MPRQHRADRRLLRGFVDARPNPAHISAKPVEDLLRLLLAPKAGVAGSPAFNTRFPRTATDEMEGAEKQGGRGAWLVKEPAEYGEVPSLEGGDEKVGANEAGISLRINNLLGFLRCARLGR